MSWDGIVMGGKFLQRANALHPEDADEESVRAEMLGVQDLFYECYANSFSKDRLISQLEKLTHAAVPIPDDFEGEEDSYRSGYISAAQKVLKEIKSVT